MLFLKLLSKDDSTNDLHQLAMSPGPRGKGKQLVYARNSLEIVSNTPPGGVLGLGSDWVIPKLSSDERHLFDDLDVLFRLL
uniref:Uncharacterized protein n=1 Tax=Hippocampus comes TaxID=109280 RepID=A0A3Q3DMU0_HIPCM